jgi:hypothetical protein
MQRRQGRRLKIVKASRDQQPLKQQRAYERQGEKKGGREEDKAERSANFQTRRAANVARRAAEAEVVAQHKTKRKQEKVVFLRSFAPGSPGENMSVIPGADSAPGGSSSPPFRVYIARNRSCCQATIRLLVCPFISSII